MGRLVGFIKIIRPLNSIMMGFGIIVGILVSGRTDLLSFGWTLLYIFSTGFTLTGAAMAINDYFDREIDSVNEPQRPIPSGEVSPMEAIGLTIAFSLIGLLAAWLTCFYCFLVALFSWVIMVAYSAWGKRTGLLGNLMVSICISLPFMYGGLLAENLLASTIFSSIAFLTNTGREINKGIVDIRGDRVSDIDTVAVSHGPAFAAKLAAFFYSTAVSISFIPYLWDMVSIWYLPFVLVTDLILVYGSYSILTKPNREVSRKTKNIVLYGMLSGLVGFALGSIF